MSDTFVVGDTVECNGIFALLLARDEGMWVIGKFEPHNDKYYIITESFEEYFTKQEKRLVETSQIVDWCRDFEDKCKRHNYRFRGVNISLFTDEIKMIARLMNIS